MHAGYASKGVTVVGIHAPEFDHEKDPENVMKNVRELGIEYPVVLDNDFSMWNALGNRYWPTIYLVDGEGRIRRIHEGEMHEGTAADRSFRAELDAILSAGEREGARD